MALVNFLKFSADRGAIIADEEYWNVFFRKRMHGNNLHALLDPDIAKQWEMQIVYGSVGYPSLHKEVVEDTRKHIRGIYKDRDSKALHRVKDVARIAFDYIQEAIRRRIDQKLKFYYGFSTDELNKGSFQVGDEDYPIETASVKSAARKLANRETKDPILKAAIESKAAVFGYDKDGMTGYYLAGENSIMGYVHEGFEAIGSGKYASGLVFGQDFKTKTVKMRQDGYETAEGLFELIDSAFLASEHFKEVGGTLNFVFLNRTGKDNDAQYQEIFDHRANLATEIVKAVRADILTRKIAVKLLDKLVLGHKSFDSIEKELFSSVTDPVALHFLLRQYKLEEIKQLTKSKSAKTVLKYLPVKKGAVK